jgi:peroxiredoxin
MRSVYLVALVLVCACGGAGTSTPTGPRATPFTLKSFDGDEVSLQTYLDSDNVVLLNFWATWCGPCAYELPHLERLYKEYRDRGFVVLGVSMDGAETRPRVPDFVVKYSLTYPVLLDEHSQVVNAYNPNMAAPHNVLIDRHGVIAWAKEGYLAGDEIQLEQQVEKAVRQQP